MSCDIIKTADSGNSGDFPGEQRKLFLDPFMDCKGTIEDSIGCDRISENMISHK